MKKASKILLFSMILALAIPVANLNAQLFDEGDIVLSAGIGLGATYYSGIGNKTTIPPVWIAGDYCLREALGPGNLGVGGYIGYSAYKWHYTYFDYDYGTKYGNLIIAGRGTYHFVDLVDKLDLYGGVLLGFRIVSHKDFGDWQLDYDYNYNASSVAYSLFAGARYFLSDNFGVMAELGYGIAYLSLGASLKL